jgi:hypothetical protein
MRIGRLLGCLVALFLIAAPAAHAGQQVGAPIAPPASMTVPPPGFRTTAAQAGRIALRQPAIARALRANRRARLDIEIWDAAYWQVSVAEAGKVPTATADISAYGEIFKVYSGIAAGSYFARGDFDPHFSRPWVWFPFGVLFLLPFLDFRRGRRRRLLHLDLAVLTGGFGLSYWTFDAGGHAERAALLIYLPLLYVLGRMAWAGLRGIRPQGPLVPWMPTTLLVVGLVALCGARVAANVDGAQVMDIGYASVVGADRIEHRQQLYVDNDQHGDTYGPINYLAYVPFELAFPWHGMWDSLPAAHAAAIAFDLLTIVGLVLLGLRLLPGRDGRRLGLALGWAWAANPFTLLGLMRSTNDGLVALLLVGALLLWRSGAGRGAMLGLAAATKFSPAALLVLFARGEGRSGAKRVVGAFAAVVVVSFSVYFPAGGFRELWNCTLGFQLSRTPDFSLWGAVPSLAWTQKPVEVVALAIIAALALARVPRTLPRAAALSAATLVATQLPAGHWFYFYIMWFLPLVLVALFVPHATAAAAAAQPVQEGDGDVVALPAAPDLALAS